MVNIILIILDCVRRDFFTLHADRFTQLKADFVEFTNCNSIYTDTPRSSYSIFFGDYFNKSIHPNFPYQLQKRGYSCRSFCNGGIILMYPHEDEEDESIRHVRPFRRQMIEDLGLEPEFNWKVSLFGHRLETYYGAADDEARGVPYKWMNHLEHMQGEKNFVFLHFWNTHHPYGINRYINEKILGENYVELGMGIINLIKAGKISEQFVRDIYSSNIAEIYSNYIETIFSILQTRGMYEDSLIFITADHGEGLGDVGYDDLKLKVQTFLHKLFVRSPKLNKVYPKQVPPVSKWDLTSFFHAGDHNLQREIPLWVKFPGSKFSGIRYSKPVSLFDLVHTINEELGYDLVIRTNHGTSLRSLLKYGDKGRDYYLIHKRARGGR